MTRLESHGHARNTLASGLGRSPPYTTLDLLSAMAGYTADDRRLIHQHCVARVQGVAGRCVVAAVLILAASQEARRRIPLPPPLVQCVHRNRWSMGLPDDIWSLGPGYVRSFLPCDWLVPVTL